MVKLGIYIVLPKYIPKISHPCCACIISKVIRLPCHANVSTENLDLGTHCHIDFRFFNKVSWKTITSDLTIFDDTTISLFGCPNIQIIHHSNSSRPLFSYPYTMATRAPSSMLMKFNNLKYHNTLCNCVLTMNFLLKPQEYMPLKSMEK